MGSPRKFSNSSEPHSAIVGAIVGPKAVYVRSDCSTFLFELGKIAFISVWSSMKKSTTDSICQYLFRDMELPFLILGLNSCKTLKCRDKSGRVIPFKVQGTNKELFLKNLDTLFNGSEGCFSSNNTIVVDDSPSKHILNKSENVILPESWSYKGNGHQDTFLLGILLPWIQRLHAARDQGLRAFRGNGPRRIGRKMLCDERSRREYDKLMEVVQVSSHL